MTVLFTALLVVKLGIKTFRSKPENLKPGADLLRQLRLHSLRPRQHPTQFTPRSVRVRLP